MHFAYRQQLRPIICRANGSTTNSSNRAHYSSSLDRSRTGRRGAHARVPHRRPPHTLLIVCTQQPAAAARPGGRCAPARRARPPGEGGQEALQRTTLGRHAPRASSRPHGAGTRCTHRRLLACGPCMRACARSPHGAHRAPPRAAPRRRPAVCPLL